nr:hypothetical protein [Lachnoclostridium phocaeense]
MAKVTMENGCIARGKYRYREGENVFVKYISGGRTYWCYGEIAAASGPVFDEDKHSFRAFPVCMIENNGSVYLTDRNIIYIMHRTPEGYTEEEIGNLKAGRIIVADDRNDFQHTDYAGAKAAEHERERCGETTEDLEEDRDFSDEDTEN